MIPARAAPNNNGKAITRIDMIIASIPTPIRNAFENPECCFPATPSTILAIPLKRRDIPMNAITTNAAAIGNDNAIPAKMRTKIPRPIVAHLDLEEGVKMPVIIFSIPTKKRIAESRATIQMKVRAGKVRA